MTAERDTSARSDEPTEGAEAQEVLHEPPVLIFFLPLVVVIVWAILSR